MADGTEGGGVIRWGRERGVGGVGGTGVRVVMRNWGGWGGGGDLNLKGALPQWESLPMNNHTDEPQREGGMGGRRGGE